MTWRILDWMAEENMYQAWTLTAVLQQQQHNIHVSRKHNLLNSYAYFHPLLLQVGGTEHQPTEDSQQMSDTFNRAMYHALVAVEERAKRNGCQVQGIQ